MLKRTCLTVFAFLVIIQSALAQSPPTTKSEQDFSPSIGFSTSYSPTSFKFWGTIENTQQFYLSAIFNHTRLETGSVNFHLGSELIVTSLIKFPIDGRDGPRERLNGYGLIPLNLFVPILNSENTPFFTTSAGFIITDASFPNHLGTRFNYILDIGLGYQFNFIENRTFQAGYKLHHLSNGNSGSENPGIDSHMFFLRILFDL